MLKKNDETKSTVMWWDDHFEPMEGPYKFTGKGRRKRKQMKKYVLKAFKKCTK